MTGSASTPGGTSPPITPPGSFSTKGTFILRKLSEHDPAKLKDVLADVYRDAVPDPADMTKFEWEVILRFLGATPRRDQGRAAPDGASMAVIAARTARCLITALGLLALAAAAAAR